MNQQEKMNRIELLKHTILDSKKELRELGVKIH